MDLTPSFCCDFEFCLARVSVKLLKKNKIEIIFLDNTRLIRIQTFLCGILFIFEKCSNGKQIHRLRHCNQLPPGPSTNGNGTVFQNYCG